MPLTTLNTGALWTLVKWGFGRVVEIGKRRSPFRLRQVTFKGRGLRPELREADWERIRDLAYGDPAE